MASGVSEVRARMRSVSCSSSGTGGRLVHEQSEIGEADIDFAAAETAIRFDLQAEVLEPGASSETAVASDSRMSALASSSRSRRTHACAMFSVVLISTWRSPSRRWSSMPALVVVDRGQVVLRDRPRRRHGGGCDVPRLLCAIACASRFPQLSAMASSRSTKRWLACRSPRSLATMADAASARHVSPASPSSLGELEGSLGVPFRLGEPAGLGVATTPARSGSCEALATRLLGQRQRLFEEGALEVGLASQRRDPAPRYSTSARWDGVAARRPARSRAASAAAMSSTRSEASARRRSASTGGS